MIKTVKEYIKAKEDIYPWERTGLLDSVSAADKEILIRKLNQAALFLANSSEDIKKHNVLILATIARAYHQHKYIIKDTMLVINYILAHLHLIKDFEKPGVDAEAEFCALMAKKISEKKL